MIALITRVRSMRYFGDGVAIALIVAFALLYLSPALKDGPSFGPADIGAGLSALTSGAITTPIHNVVNGDIIDQGIPWSTLDWHLIHAGELPLWNNYSGSGLPQFLNFESGVFSLPSLVSYLFPLSLAFLASVGTKLLIAGCGTYLFVRLLGARQQAAFLAGVTFMLSGSFTGWLGWATGAPLAWAGFLGAGVVLAYRSRQRVREIALLAVSVAFAIYAGFPETDVLLAGGLAVMVLVTGAATLWSKRPIAGRGVIRIALGLVAGALLSSPLWFPGLSVIKHSARNGKNAASGLPLHALFLAFAQGYDGLPIKGSAYFGPLDYFETTSYVGVLAIIFAGVALLCWWKRPIVVGCGLGALFSLACIYDLGPHAPVQHLIRDLGLGVVALQRMLPVLAFFIAVLAGLGLEKFCSDMGDRRTRLSLLFMGGLVLVVLAVMWSKASSATFLASPPAPANPTNTTPSALREASLSWPSAEALVLAVFAGGLVLSSGLSERTKKALRRLVPTAVCGAQALFLLFAGVGINSYAKVSYPATPAVRELASIVGTRLFAMDGGNATCLATSPQPCGVRQWTGIGFYPEMNIAYGLRELGLHDPTMPAAYFTSWPVGPSDRIFAGNLNLFVPAVTSASLAWRYGVSYVLVAPKVRPPTGMTKVTEIPTQRGVLSLYAVPGASQFGFEAPNGVARVTAVVHPGDASWRIAVHVTRPSVLVLRVTNVPGFHVSADGRTLSTHVVDGIFLSVVVPRGTDVVTLRYWPNHLSLSFALALLTLVIFFGYGLARRNLSLRMRRRNTQP